jgi:hypothetical protein
MIDLIAIKNGPWVNLSLASVKFDKNGTRNNLDVIVVDDWREIFDQNKRHVLCVGDRTVFMDIETFLEKLKNYPNQGLIGHIVDPMDGTPFYLHEQCFYLDLDHFDLTDFDTIDMEFPRPRRSDQNIHHDYTPLWLLPGKEKNIRYISNQFGAGLIQRQLQRGKIVSNWDKKIRELKRYLYTDDLLDDWITQQQDYLELAEKQFWILNNEVIRTLDCKTLISPASGLCWINNLLQESTTEVLLVDISRTQCHFAQHLIDHWDGRNYGGFVYDYLVANKIFHFNLEDPTVDQKEKIRLIATKEIIDKVNDVFGKYFDDSFPDRWTSARNKSISIYNQDIVEFLKDRELSESKVWISNILDYKYTLLKNDYQSIRRLDERLRENS